MTVSTTTVRNEYAGNGVTISFPFTFRILQREDLIVSVIDDATGEETGLEFGTDYTITGVGASNGGSISTGLWGAPASGQTIVLRRELDITQPSDYSNQGRFYPETHERSFDRLTMIAQQLADGVDRAVTQPENGSDWFDARGRRIVNLGDAIENTDAVNVRVMNEAIGNALEGIGGYVIPLTWTFTGDGSTTGVNIDGAQIADPRAYHVTIDGLVQTPTTDYTITLATEVLTFTSAPPDGSAVLIRSTGYAAAVVAEDWDADGNRIINVGSPVAATDAATKDYVDDAVAGLAAEGHTHAASDIVSGLMSPDRLGLGTRTGAKFLRDDGLWTDVGATLALPFTTRGDMLVYDGTDAVRLPSGTGGYVLASNASAANGVEWVEKTDVSAVQGVIAGILDDSSQIDFTVNSPNSITATIKGSGVVTASIADSAVTTAKIANGNVTEAKLSSNAVTTAKIANNSVNPDKMFVTGGTANASSYYRGDATWHDPSDTFAAISHTHATTDIVSGIMAAERLGSGYGAIPSGDENLYYLSADGSWSIPAGGGGGGSGWSNEASQDAVGAILLPTTTVTLTYNDATPSITAAVNAGSIGLTEIDTASLDTRYALAGSVGALPPGGTSTKFLRGDGGTGLWTNVLPDPVYIGSTANTISAGGITLNQGLPATSSSFAITSNGQAGTTTFSMSAGATGSPLSFGITCDPVAGGENTDLFSFQHVNGANANGYGQLTIVTNSSFWLPVTMLQTLSVSGAITGSSFTGSVAASNINSGIIAPARLGSGTPSISTYLRGDGSWATVAGGSSLAVADTATIDLSLDLTPTLTASVIDGSITSPKLANGSVTNSKLADANVTTGKLADASVTTAKIVDANVTTAKILDAAVTTAKILDGSVTAAKLAAGAVTIPKIAATGTASATTFLRGDGAWATPPSAASGVTGIFGVDSYGATGDGATDDTAAINAAIAAAYAAGGGIVLFPYGNYRITSTIDLSAGKVSLMGVGRAVSQIVWGGAAGGDMIRIKDLCNMITVERFTIRGGASNMPARIFDLGTIQRCSFRDLELKRFTDVGIRMVAQGTVITNEDSAFNHFEAIFIDARNDGDTPVATGIVLTSDSPGVAARNCCHNTFVNVCVTHQGGTGYALNLGDSDNNNFNMFFCYHPGTAYDVRLGDLARSNFFLHLQGEVTAVGTLDCWNVITNYDTSNGQRTPNIGANASLEWRETGSAAVVRGTWGENVKLNTSGSWKILWDTAAGDMKFISPAVPAGKLLASM